jgi:hypothetical protein
MSDTSGASMTPNAFRAEANLTSSVSAHPRSAWKFRKENATQTSSTSMSAVKAIPEVAQGESPRLWRFGLASRAPGGTTK